MGAYSLVPLTEICHIAMLVFVSLITIRDLPAEAHPMQLECYETINDEKWKLQTMHVLCAVLLAMPRIFTFCQRSQAKKSLKVWIRSKSQQQNPVVFDILALTALCLYISFLFNANRFFAKCEEPLEREQFIQFLKIEELLFFANLLGMCVFLLFKALMGRCRSKF